MVTCTFDGNTDMYGLGIRLAFYLLWFSSILAAWITPGEVPSIRFSISIFIAATFLGLIIQTSQGTLQVVEIYIILLLTFGYYLWFIPLYLWRALTCCKSYMDPSRYPLVRAGQLHSVLNFFLLIAVAAFQIWFWFSFVPGLNTSKCQQFGFFFAPVPLNETAFQVVNGILYIVLLAICVAILLIRISLSLGLVEEIDDDDESERELSPERVEVLQTWYTVINIIVASTVVTATELTVQWNNINNVNSLSSAGQLIPFLISIGALVRILYLYVRDPDDGSTSTGPVGRYEIPLRK